MRQNLLVGLGMLLFIIAPVVAEQPVTIDLSGWDWDAVPADEPQPRERTVETKPKEAEAPRVGSTARPDFTAERQQAVAFFPGMPDFTIIPSIKHEEMMPCRNCHEWTKGNPTPRTLKEPHNNFTLQHGLHGKGQFWCFTCHHLEGDGGLRTLEGDKVAFDNAYLICSQCHAQQAQDWANGAHGKRIGSWRGERESLVCTACHYQHQPRFAPRKPMPGPQIRQRLERPDHWRPERQREPIADRRQRVWERGQRE